MIVRSQHKVSPYQFENYNVDKEYVEESIKRQVKDLMTQELHKHVTVTSTFDGQDTVYKSEIHVVSHEDIKLMRSLIKEIADGGTMARFDLINLLRTF
jgi:hypothetical protein